MRLLVWCAATRALASVVACCLIVGMVDGSRSAEAASVLAAGTVGASCAAADITAADALVLDTASLCVAEKYRTTRGYLRPNCLTDLRALVPFAEYQPADCKGQKPGVQAEAVAQSRVIAQLNAAGTAGATAAGGITPNLQWETVPSGASGPRVDVLSYQPQATTGPMDIAEVKVSGAGSFGNVTTLAAATAAKTQVDGYVQTFQATTSRPVRAYNFSGRPFDDHFKIVFERCRWDPTRRFEFVYHTFPDLSRPGVLVSEGTENPCPPKPKVRTAPEGQAATSEVYQGEIGADRNNNGIDDFLDYVREHPELWRLPVRIPQRVYRIVKPVQVQLGGDALLEVEETMAQIEAAELTEAGKDALFRQLVEGLGQAAADVTADLAAGDAAALGLTAEEFATAGTLAEAGFILLPEVIIIAVVIAAIFAAIWALHHWNASGDPHLATLDGLAYDLQSVGEFHLLQVPSQGVDVQARFVPMGSSRTISILSQVAFSLNGARVSIDSAGKVRVDDVLQPSTSSWIDLGDGAAIIRKGGQTLVTFPGASGVTMAMSGSAAGFRVPAGVPTSGLLGNHDGKPGNDLVTASGEQVTTAPAAVIYGRYADSWRVTADESQYTYSDDTNTSSFSDRTFPDQVKTLADFPAADVASAQATCFTAGVVVGPQLDDCTFDVVSTGDATYARAAAASTNFLQDPDAAVLDANGVLSNTFDAAIPPNLKPLSVRDLASGKAAGPIFDASGYSFSVPAVPPHLSVTSTFELESFGLTGSATGSLTLAVDGTDAAVLDLTAGAASVRSGPATVVRIGPAVTPTGESYTRYTVTLTASHVADQLRVTLKPSGFRGVIGTSLAVDNLQVTAALVPPQSFTGAFNAALPGTPAPVGAGVLENRAAHDIYSLGAPAAGGAGLLVTPVTCPADLQWDLRDGTGATLLHGGCTTSEIRASALTGVSLDVHPGPGAVAPATYAMKVLSVPGDVSAGALTLDGAAVTMGTAAAGQRAVATFTGSAGQLVALQTSASTVPAGSAVTATVITPSGGTVLSMQGEQTSRRLALPVTGTYTVMVDPAGVATGGLAVKLISAAVPTAVSLTTSTTGGALTATATANGLVSSSDSTWIGVYDTTTGERLGYCGSGTTCTINNIVPKGGGIHSLAAAVGSIPSTWSGSGSGWVVSAGAEVAGWVASVSSVTAANGTLTVTATTNYPVSGAGSYYAGIYDSVTKERIGYCSTGTTCTLSGVVVHGAGAHTLVAAVGPTPASWNEVGNWTASTPLSVPAWSASLTSATAANGTLTVTATTNYPVSSSGSYYLGIYDQSTKARFGYCSTGMTCTLSNVTLQGAGAHNLVAAVGPTPVTWSDTGNWAVSNVVNSAGWSVALSSATATNGTLSATATTNLAVNSGVGIYVGIYDSVTKERFGYCSTGTVCTVNGIVPHGAGAHTLVAAAGPTPVSWSDTGNLAVSNQIIPAAWSASLTSATATNGTLTLTATTNYPVSGGGLYTGIYDSVTKERIGYCSTGTTCTLSGVVVHGAGAHTLVAAAGPTPASWSDTGNWGASPALPVAAWSASLASVKAANGTLTLTATTNYPVSSSGSYYAGIYDSVTKERIGYCSTGTTCTLSGVVVHGAGAHTLVAAAGPTPASWNEAGNWAVSSPVDVPIWAATLSSVKELNGTLTLTATTNYPVSGAGLYVGIYDSVTKERFGYCSTGTTCTLSGVVVHGAGAHTLVAAAGPTPATWNTTGNWVVSSGVEAPPWSVGLVATKAGNGTWTLTATTNYPVNGASSLWLGLYDQTTGIRFGYCSTAMVCSLSGVAITAAGTHNLVAAAGSTPVSWSPTGAWAISSVVPVVV